MAWWQDRKYSNIYAYNCQLYVSSCTPVLSIEFRDEFMNSDPQSPGENWTLLNYAQDVKSSDPWIKTQHSTNVHTQWKSSSRKVRLQYWVLIMYKPQSKNPAGFI